MFGRFIKFLIALVLLPLVVAELWTLIDLARLSVPAGQWRAAWFTSFGAGFVTWLLVFVFLPRTMWIYVLGHEFTHALAAMMAGGKVSAFKVTSTGGHIMTDRVNWWIALSPYFVPIYSLIWIGLWLTVDFYHPLKEWLPLLFFGLGLTWSFHLTFTVSMFHLGQTDLTGQGVIFSFVIIFGVNLLAILFLFSFLAPGGMIPGSRLFGDRVAQIYVLTAHEMERGMAWAQQEWERHRASKA